MMELSLYKMTKTKKRSKKPSKKPAKTQPEDDSDKEKGATLTGERHGERGPYENYGNKPKMTDAEKKVARAIWDKRYITKKKSAKAKDRASLQKLRGTILKKFSKG